MSGYSIITPSGSIDFLFEERATFPSVVAKRGQREKLGREWQNHRIAEQILPSCVPELLDYREQGGEAEFRMRYVPEVLFVNRLARNRTRRHADVLSAVVDMLEACADVLRRELSWSVSSGSAGTSVAPSAVSSELRTMLALGGITAAASEFIGEGPLRIPTCFQHGDFCARNVLLGPKGRLTVIDWEDAGGHYWPFVDLEMLLCSLDEIYREVSSRETFLSEPSARALILRVEGELSETVGIEPRDAIKVTVASCLQLHRENLGRERPLVAEGILAHGGRRLRNWLEEGRGRELGWA